MEGFEFLIIKTFYNYFKDEVNKKFAFGHKYIVQLVVLKERRKVCLKYINKSACASEAVKYLTFKIYSRNLNRYEIEACRRGG